MYFLPIYLCLQYVRDDLAEIADLTALEARTSQWKERRLRYRGKENP